MTRSKLSEFDKQSILALYQEPLETTSTLAERYGVSSTTIRRILRSSLSQQEYETLTNQKQVARFHSPRSEETPTGLSSEDINSGEIAPPGSANQPSLSELVKVEEAPLFINQDGIALEEPTSHSTRRLRKRSSAASMDTVSQTEPPIPVIAVDTVASSEEAKEPTKPLIFKDYDSSRLYDSEEQAEDFRELQEELDDGIEDLEDSSFEDSLEAEVQDPLDEERPYLDNHVSTDSLIPVLPLSEAVFPGTYYLVIDRFADLITRPLKDFADLGRFPSEEFQERTLPIFDNHRVARRFSNRTQRVIKIPNGSMLQKVCSHLYSKGITRLLINGQVYSL